jgi:tetratricopeptide (TPR) repeat protein
MSRPSTASRTESPDSDQWWRTQQFSEIQKSAGALRKAGDFSGLEKLYVRALAQARATKNLRAQAGYLTALGNTYVYLFRYTDAIAAYAEARDLAHASSDWLAEGAVAPGLSSVYSQVGDWPAARESAQAGLEAAKRLPAPPYYDAQLKLQHARLNPGADGSKAEILQALEAARAQGNDALEAEAWDLLGEERMRRKELSSAELALNSAFHIRSLRLQRDLRLSYWRLGALRLAQGLMKQASPRWRLRNDVEGSEVSSRNLLLQRLIESSRQPDGAARRSGVQAGALAPGGAAAFRTCLQARMRSRPADV